MKQLFKMLLNTQQRLMMLELYVQLDKEIEGNYRAIDELIHRNMRQFGVGMGRKKRTIWIRTWLTRRHLLGHYEKLMVELSTEDPAGYKNFVRMGPDLFESVVNRLTPHIQKQDTFWRKALVPGIKVAITLRYLATGETYKSLHYGFRVGANTISLLVKEVCDAIILEYGPELMVPPLTSQGWKKVADQFSVRWNFHHCLGALDGKHVAIRCPKKSGSLYYNYKGFYSIVLLALVDGDYKFLWVEAGANGAGSDAQIFNASELRELLDENKLGIPDKEPLPGGDTPVPYFIVGDDAFPLKTYMMKPYSRRNLGQEDMIFNYRLSRARRIVENAFGILSNRFACMLTTMKQEPETVTSIILACCCLHNLLRDVYPTLNIGLVDEEDREHRLIPGAWRTESNLTDGQTRGGNTTQQIAKKQREYLSLYYNSPVGAVSWQNRMVVLD